MSKILLFDIETAPNLGWIWGKYEQNVIEYQSEWYMLCFAAKWLGQNKIITSALSDFSTYKKNKEDDRNVLNILWKLLDEADIVIAHNAIAFDIRKANARFLAHGMTPPSPYKVVDTLRVARKYFKFNSNKLDDLGEHLGIGRKIATGGFGLWKGCMNGDNKSWKKMIQYNKQDVKLLEDVYLKLRPWIISHPHRGLLDEKEKACPNCNSNKLQRRGFTHTRVSVFQRWQCVSCGAWSRSRLAEKTIKPKII
ncbi:MAG: RNase H superfamily protein [Planctomycetia bacterium]|nr:RNase H superfamily protein [Planctomycetia bacterium]